MICRTVDSVTSAHPWAAKYCRSRIEIFFDTSDGRNIAVFMIAGITAGIFAGLPNEILRYTALGIAAIVCAQAAVLAGFLRQWLFVFFASLYLMIPYVFIITPDTAEAAQASGLQYLLSDLMQSVVLMPMRRIAGDGDAQLVSIIILLICIVLFFIGTRIRSRAKRSDFYCRTRLEQIK